MQEKILLRQPNVNDDFINVSDLPNGVYVYRLLQNDQTIDRGKIIK